MRVISFDTLNSTNIWAKEHFFELEDKTVIVASSQTQGKGRFNRIWLSENCGNLYMTLVLKPEKTDFAANFTQLMSVACAQTVEEFGVEPMIKWPNDVLLNGKKISGILNEVVNKEGKACGFVLGIGVNLNMPEHMLTKISQPAASLSVETGKSIDIKEFMQRLCEKFFYYYESVVNEGFIFFKDDYISYVDYLGKSISVSENQGLNKIKYKAVDFDRNGNLVVLDSENRSKIIYSGDLIL